MLAHFSYCTEKYPSVDYISNLLRRFLQSRLRTHQIGDTRFQRDIKLLCEKFERLTRSINCHFGTLLLREIP